MDMLRKLAKPLAIASVAALAFQAPAQQAQAPALAPVQQQAVPQQSPQERCDALKAKLLKDAYDWHIYAQIGDLQMDMGRPREAASSYEKALAIYPLSKERGAELRQAEFLAAQANAEQQRQKIAKEAAEKQAQDAAMANTMQALSMLPGASSTNALMFQQGLSAAATMSQGMSQYNANMAQGQIAGILGPSQQINYSLPEKQENATLWIKLGKAYAASSEHEKAGAAFEQGGSIDPARFDAMYLTGLSLLSMGQGSKSLVAANRYLAMMPGEAPFPVCMLIGDAYRSLGMQSEAKTAYAMAVAGARKASDQKPGDLQALLQLANAQARTGDYSGGAASFKKACSYDSGFMASGGLAVCLMSLDDSASLKSLLPDLKAKAANYDDFYLLARVQDFLGDEASAKASYAKCVELWDKAGAAKQRQPGIVAVARAGAGNPEEGIALLKERLDREPCASDAYLDFYRLALAYSKLKEQPRPDLEAEALRQCLDDNPSYSQAAVELKRLVERFATQATALLSQSNEAFKAGDKPKAAVLRAQAWAIMPDGQDRDRVLQECAEIVKEIPQQEQPLPKEASDSWLKGNSIFAAKRSCADVRRAALEFRHAFVLAPWNYGLLLNLAACQSAMDRADLAKASISLAQQNPGGKGQDVLAKLFDYERQRSSSERDWRDLNPFKN